MARRGKLPADGKHFSQFSLPKSSTNHCLFSPIFLVICLSDDDNDDNSNNDIPIETPIQQSSSSMIVDGSNQDIIYEPSGWTIDPKDKVHVYELPSKYSDISKKPFEIRCKAVRFGIAEFTIESEVILMKEKEFEMRMTGKHHFII